MAQTLDGSASNNTWASATSGTVTLTTSDTNDLIVVCVATMTAAGNVPVTSVTSTHLTFTLRNATTYHDSGDGVYLDIEEWTAPSTGTLTSEVITVHTGSNVDQATIFAFGVNGCYNISVPYDPNGSLPVKGISVSGTPVETLSTTRADNVLFTSIALYGNGLSYTLAGWTQLNGTVVLINGSLHWTGFTNIVSATQASVSCSPTEGISRATVLLADAFTGSGPTPSTLYTASWTVSP